MSRVQLYDRQSRQAVLSRLEEALRTDEQIAGALLVGSGAKGFIDELSDLDLAVVVANSSDALNVFHRWGATLHEELCVLWSFSDARGPEVGLYALLLSDFLEVDISFQSLSVLSARSPDWRVLFDRTGNIQPIMEASARASEQPSLLDTYWRRLDSSWHYITHVALCIRRGHIWRALHYLEELRNRTIELEGLLCGCRTRHFRDVDELPNDRLAALEKTLVGSTDSADVAQALRAATDCFFETASRVERECGLKKAERLQKSMEEFLRLVAL